MASGTIRDITPGIVLGLAHDKTEETDYASRLWQRLHDERPKFSRFIEQRLREAFPDDTDGQGKALAILLETISLDERVAFADQMRAEIGDAAPYLGGLALETDHLNPDILPTAELDFGTEAA